MFRTKRIKGGEEGEVVERCCLGVAVRSRTLLLIGCSVFSACTRSVVRRSQVALAVLILCLAPSCNLVASWASSLVALLRTISSIPLGFVSVKIAKLNAGKPFYDYV